MSAGSHDISHDTASPVIAGRWRAWRAYSAVDVARHPGASRGTARRKLAIGGTGRHRNAVNSPDKSHDTFGPGYEITARPAPEPVEAA